MNAAPPPRIVLAKLGLDGHDRGLKIVARTLRDAGMEIIYLGLRQTASMIVTAAEQEDADAVGLSMHNAGHLTLGPKMVKALADSEIDVPVVIGGIIPPVGSLPSPRKPTMNCSATSGSSALPSRSISESP